MIVSAVVALGSSLGGRRDNLRAAVRALGPLLRVVRVSSVWESEPLDAPAGSPPFLNMVVAGWTAEPPGRLLEGMHAIEAAMGRRRRIRNEPRVLDLDLILYGGFTLGGGGIEVPHPRYRRRNFVVGPLQELGLDWVDPATGVPIRRLRGEGTAAVAGPLFGDR